MVPTCIYPYWEYLGSYLYLSLFRVPWFLPASILIGKSFLVPIPSSIPIGESSLVPTFIYPYWREFRGSYLHLSLMEFLGSYLHLFLLERVHWFPPASNSNGGSSLVPTCIYFCWREFLGSHLHLSLLQRVPWFLPSSIPIG